MSTQKLKIDWDAVKKKMEAGCKAKEIVGSLGISEDTFCRRFREYFGSTFADVAPSYRSTGEGNLRCLQYQKALEGSVPMLILLGKERLGQGKEQEKVSPFEDIIEMRHQNTILRAELSKLKKELERVYADQPYAGHELRGGDAQIQHMGGGGQLGEDICQH